MIVVFVCLLYLFDCCICLIVVYVCLLYLYYCCFCLYVLFLVWDLFICSFFFVFDRRVSSSFFLYFSFCFLSIRVFCFDLSFLMFFFRIIVLDRIISMFVFLLLSFIKLSVLGFLNWNGVLVSRICFVFVT